MSPQTAVLDRTSRRHPLGTAPTAALWLLVAAALLVGLWAQVAPASFYADFPAPGRAWVSLDGPYNEHLVRDVGGLNLALAALTVAAALARRASSAAVAATAWLVYGVPHLLYHATHLGPLTAGDAAAQVVALSLQVLVPVWLLAIAARRRREPQVSSGSGR